MAGVSTICVQGFPPEASPRELKNLCRFVKGFVHAHVAFAAQSPMALPSALFCKFESPELAAEAIEAVSGQPYDLDSPGHTLKAELARRELEVRPNSRLPVQMAATGAQASAWPVHRPPVVVQRPTEINGVKIGSTGGELVTLAVLSLAERGLLVEEVQNWFSGQAGFVTSQPNERLGGIFVKFDSQANAEMALQEANANQYGAQWARRNLDDDRSAPLGATGGSRRVTTSGEELVTLAVLALREKGLDGEEVQQWFHDRRGLVKVQWNDRLGGLFAKFESYADAENAMQETNAMGYGADWARRNLDDERPWLQGQPQQLQNGAQQRGGYQQGYGGQQGYSGQQSYGRGYGGACSSGYGGQQGCGGGKGYGVQQGYDAGHGQYGGPPKRQRGIGIDGELNTIVVMGISLKQNQHSNLQEYFQGMQGFVALQLNEKVDMLFVKFTSRALADEAMSEANAATNLGVQWARRNLDL